MKQRSSPPSSANARSSTRRDTAKPGFSRQQRLVLILVGILVAAWAILGAVLLFSHPGQPVPALNTLPAALAQASAAGTPAPTSTPVISVPAACAQSNSGTSQGTAFTADDGTVDIRTDGQTTRVRLAGILIQAGGALQIQAVQALRTMIDGKTVTLARDAAAQDASGLLPGYLFVGNHFINYELVRQGLAAVDSTSPDRACTAQLMQAEQQARAERQGLWNPTPAPTHTFMPLVTLDLSTQTACDCSKKYVCSDFKTHAEAQTCFNACNDYSSKLDPNHNGIACEELP